MCDEPENPPVPAAWYDEGRKCIYCGGAIKRGQMIHRWNDEEPNHHLDRDCRDLRVVASNVGDANE